MIRLIKKIIKKRIEIGDDIAKKRRKNSHIHESKNLFGKLQSMRMQ